MDLSRRDVLAGSVFAFGASALVLGSEAAMASAGDEAAVTERVDVLRKATFEADKAKLEQLTSTQLSYGHSGGRVETKDQFQADAAGGQELEVHWGTCRSGCSTAHRRFTRSSPSRRRPSTRGSPLNEVLLGGE